MKSLSKASFCVSVAKRIVFPLLYALKSTVMIGGLAMGLFMLGHGVIAGGEFKLLVFENWRLFTMILVCLTTWRYWVEARRKNAAKGCKT